MDDDLFNAEMRLLRPPDLTITIEPSQFEEYRNALLDLTPVYVDGYKAYVVQVVYKGPVDGIRKIEVTLRPIGRAS